MLIREISLKELAHQRKRPQPKIGVLQEIFLSLSDNAGTNPIWAGASIMRSMNEGDLTK